VRQRLEIQEMPRPGMIVLSACSTLTLGPNPRSEELQDPQAGVVTSNDRGLHGYISFTAERPPSRSEFSAGVGFYSAVWPLVGEPLAHFQIGLPSVWIIPDNSDNKDTPLAPVGTYARDHWPNRGPTYEDVFQTIEGGLGYWAGNHFRYGPPKFNMNATPQCYDYEVGSPGWSFFYDNEALPDDRLGIAQLSNRLLIPPDALTFDGHPNGEFLGYAYMALPFTEPVSGEPPTGGAWGRPGPVAGPFEVRLADGSIVSYSWYRFVDQPSFQQYAWSAEKKAKLQAFVEKIHEAWPIDRDSMAPPRFGKLARLDPALLVTPPKGLEFGYVPIVTRQQSAHGPRDPG
jgi:hypothetical protein